MASPSAQHGAQNDHLFAISVMERLDPTAISASPSIFRPKKRQHVPPFSPTAGMVQPCRASRIWLQRHSSSHGVRRAFARSELTARTARFNCFTSPSPCFSRGLGPCHSCSLYYNGWVQFQVYRESYRKLHRRGWVFMAAWLARWCLSASMGGRHCHRDRLRDPDACWSLAVVRLDEIRAVIGRS